MPAIKPERSAGAAEEGFAEDVIVKNLEALATSA
jgi:hypothetical protein